MSAARLLGLAAGLFVIGWALVLASGYRAGPGEDYNLAARIGGLMVYASMPVLLLAGICGLVAGVRAARRRHRH